MSESKHTPGPWFVGAQNDALYVIAGRSPSLNNDYPWHDAPRVVLAKIFEPEDGDCLPIDARANARMFAAAPEMLEALKECLPLFDMVTALDDHGSNAFGQSENLIRSAIAKATGAA